MNREHGHHTGKKVGFVGLGAMGFHMASNLVKSKFFTTVYDIDQRKIHAVIDTGAKASDSLKSLGANSDVIITMLPDDSAVEMVYLEEIGLISSVKENTILIDMGTTSIELLNKIDKQAKKKRTKLLGAPVSGGTMGAKDATLTIMVGGKKEAFEKCQDILQTMGKK